MKGGKVAIMMMSSFFFVSFRRPGMIRLARPPRRRSVLLVGWFRSWRLLCGKIAVSFSVLSAGNVYVG